MEFLVTLVTKIGKYLCVPLRSQIGYLIHYEWNVEKLKKAEGSLRPTREDLRNLVAEAGRRLEEPTEEVQEWLKLADGIEVDIAQIDRDARENKKCFYGCFPNWILRYRLSKEAAKKAEVVKELQERRNFSNVSRVRPPPPVESMHSEYVEGISCAESAMKQVMHAVNDANISIIGVHGMGGAGKTTLMKELNNKLRGTVDFRKVIMVTVSNHPDLLRIQDEIAERIGLKLEPLSAPSVRANRLFEGLTREESVLIILDDVWKRIELAEVGIPCGTIHKGFKIILTTRLEYVCRKMGTQKNVKVDVMSLEDSWVLFKVKVGDVVALPSLQLIAKKIVRECRGSPLAIVTLGSSLKAMEDQIVWQDALRVMKSSNPSEVEGIMPEVISSLRFSYDHLNGAEIKLCFLFCCLFPEDYNINLSILSYYGIGEGFLKVDGNFKAARNKFLVYIKRLKASSLLLDVDREGFVKMHDVVRDVALSIASKDGHNFAVKAGLRLKEWPEEKLEECKRVSLIKNGISVLPDRPECPQLLTLLLQHNRFEFIPDSFFENMKNLVVLDLSSNRIVQLPQSLQCLANLRTLCLGKSNNLKNISFVGQLKKLEILSITFSSITKLPVEIGELTNLKLLDLSKNRMLIKLPCNVISRLSRLEELYMGESFSRWEPEGSGHGSRACFTEVASLPCLTTLHIHVRNETYLSQEMSGPWENLREFHISVSGSYKNGAAPRSMCLDISKPVSNWVKVLLKRTVELTVVGCEGHKVVPYLDEGGLESLKFLHIDQCWDIEHLVSAGEENSQNIFKTVEELRLSGMPNLRRISIGQPLPDGFLLKLRVLEVEDCDKLINIMPFNLMQRVRNLERLRVAKCKDLQEVFHFEGKTQGHSMVFELRDLDLCDLQNLRTIWTGSVPFECLDIKNLQVIDCHSLRSFCSPVVAQRLQQLEMLRIKSCEGMMHIISSEEGQVVSEVYVPTKLGQITMTNPQPPMIFQNLQVLKIDFCGSLKNIFSTSLARGLQQLEELEVTYCHGVEEIISKEVMEDVADEGLLPRLKTLMLRDLMELRNFYCVPLSLPCLEYIRVKECPNLRRLPFGLKSALNLTKIEGEEEWFNGLQWEDRNIKSRFQPLFTQVVPTRNFGFEEIHFVGSSASTSSTF